jgi:para-aminobenzoate synthetase component 1
VPRWPSAPAFVGGHLALFGYDLVRTWENLPHHARRDLPLPLYVLIEAREFFAFDHQRGEWQAITWHEIANPAGQVESFASAQREHRSFLKTWDAAFHASEATSTPEWTPAASAPPDSFSPEAFASAARRVREYIAAGDTYQVNLSLRRSRVASAPPEWIYETLRRLNPSPYMGLVRWPGTALVCGSPELLFSLRDGRLASRPIAGTRPRGRDAYQDEHYEKELFSSAKERAEHLMLVDLLRNDLGRVAVFGSVRVPEFMVCERYSHVMHIVSQVEADVAPDRDWIEALCSIFPGGTITGCPKHRTMQIIEELEPVGRGFYTGSLGWIGFDGALELNILIRSLLVHASVAHVQSGAGIVADSVPDREYDESLRKGAALWAALDEAARAWERRSQS